MALGSKLESKNNLFEISNFLLLVTAQTVQKGKNTLSAIVRQRRKLQIYAADMVYNPISVTLPFDNLN